MRYETTARDFFYETSATALTYYITFNGVTIFNGRAVKSPNEPNLRINIGRRVSDYLRTSMPDFREFDGVVVPHPEQLMEFVLYSEEGTQLDQYRVLYCFDGLWNGGSEDLAVPIDSKADPRQKIFWGTYYDIDNGGGGGSSGKTGDTIEIDTDNDTGSTDYLTFTMLQDGSFSVGTYDTQGSSGRFEYSLDSGATWSVATYNGVAGSQNPGLWVRMVSSGDTILVRNVNNGATDFIGGVPYSVKGTTHSIIPSQYVAFGGQPCTFRESSVYDASGLYLDPRDFGRLDSFFRSSSLKYPPKEIPELLNWESGGARTYSHMFANCSYLVETPMIYPEEINNNGFFYLAPAFEHMYSQCSRLEKAYDITTQFNEDLGSLGHCRYMFYKCTSLVVGPNILTKKAQREIFLGMFEGCTSLYKAGEIMAESVGDEAMKNMFKACTALEIPPSELYAEDLYPDCYNGMFLNCSKLPYSPIINGRRCVDRSGNTITDFGVMANMFNGCSSLNKITCYYRKIGYSPDPGDDTYQWVYGVQANGIIYINQNAAYGTGVDGVPSGWAIRTIEV